MKFVHALAMDTGTFIMFSVILIALVLYELCITKCYDDHNIDAHQQNLAMQKQKAAPEDRSLCHSELFRLLRLKPLLRGKSRARDRAQFMFLQNLFVTWWIPCVTSANSYHNCSVTSLPDRNKKKPKSLHNLIDWIALPSWKSYCVYKERRGRRRRRKTAQCRIENKKKGYHIVAT